MTTLLQNIALTNASQQLCDTCVLMEDETVIVME